MKLNLRTLAAAPLFLAAAATAQTTGVSHPEALDDTITTSAQVTPATGDHYHKPSPATPAVTTSTTEETSTTTTATAGGPVLQAHHAPTVDPDDINSGVITSIASAPNELPEGTLLHVRLDQTLSTSTARRGDHFTGKLTQPVMRNGRVLVPAGSVLRGRITEVRASKHFLSDAMLRLQPDTLTLPDGIPYPVSAQLIDFDHTQDAHIDSTISPEGEVTTDPHTRQHLAGMGLTAAGAGAAGAMIGGGVGFLLGATIGAGANAIMWSRQDHQQTLEAGTVMILNIDRSLMLNPTPAPAIASTTPTGGQ